jgi:hypothetical protein
MQRVSAPTVVTTVLPACPLSLPCVACIMAHICNPFHMLHPASAATLSHPAEILFMSTQIHTCSTLRVYPVLERRMAHHVRIEQPYVYRDKLLEA